MGLEEDMGLGKKEGKGAYHFDSYDRWVGNKGIGFDVWYSSCGERVDKSASNIETCKSIETY